MSELPAIWTPSQFNGADLIPKFNAPAQVEKIEPVLGRDNISAKDMILPALKLLQGMSPVVMEGTVENAKAGMIHNTGTQEVMKAPLRVLLVHHSRSNSLIPDPVKNPATANMKKCIARDGVTGTEYGECEKCRKCLDWGPNNEPPIGAQSHNFVCMTEYGPAMLRFSRSSYKAARQFLTMWNMTPDKNLWHHPVVVKVKSLQKQLPNGTKSTYFVWEPLWQTSERTPPEVRAIAESFYHMIEASYQAGRLSGQDEEDSDQGE